MKIGVTCYPTVGGSGTVATELGLAIARRGPRGALHLLRAALPARAGPSRRHLPRGDRAGLPALPVPAVLARPRVADGRRGAQPRDRAAARALRDPARDLRPPRARDPRRRPEAGRHPARHRHHRGRRGPIVPADRAARHRARRRGHRRVAVARQRDSRAPGCQARDRGDPQLRRSRPLRPGLRGRAPPAAVARRRPASGARLELPTGQAGHGRARDLQAGPRSHSRRTWRWSATAPTGRRRSASRAKPGSPTASSSSATSRRSRA